MRRALSIILAVIALSPAQPGHATAGVVTCLMSVSLAFTPGAKVTTTSSISVALSGGGDPCAPVPSMDIPGGLVTTATLSGTGDATVAACTGVVATGTYSLDFGEFFDDSAGIFAFVGSPEGGTLTFADTNPPRSVGEAALVADPFSLGNAGQVAACAMSPAGMDELRFVGALALVTV